jgi:transcription elongation factor Elf1
MKMTKIQTEISYTLECPHCGETLSITVPIRNWIDKCVNLIGYGNDYADDSENITITCGECKEEFIIDGVNPPEIVS